MRKNASELPADIQRLLASERAAPPPIEAADRMEAEIARRLQEPSDPGGLPLRVRLRGLLAILPWWTLPSMAFALGATVAVETRSLLPTSTRGAAVQRAHPEPAYAPPAAPALIPEPAVIPVPPPTPAPAAVPPTPTPAVSPPSTLHGPAAGGGKGSAGAIARPGSGDSLDRERALIERARTALYRGANETALGYLDECERLFPHGQLAEEREALWIQSAVGAAKYRAARERGRAFARQYPHSFLLPAVEEVLRGASE